MFYRNEHLHILGLIGISSNISDEQNNDNKEDFYWNVYSN